MKLNKILSFLFISVTTAVVMTGCGEEDTVVDPGAAKPAISVTIPTTAVGSSIVGAKISFTVVATSNVTSNSDLEKFTVSRKNVDGTSTALENISIPPANQKNYGYTNDLDVGTAKGDVVFTFTVVDKKGESNTAAYTVKVGGDINMYTAVLLGNKDNAADPSFYDAITNNRLKQSEAAASSSSVDFVYYHGETNGPTLAAPNNSQAQAQYSNQVTGIQTWGVKNATKFKDITLDEAAFNAITNDTEILTAASGSVNSDTKQLNASKTFAFITSNAVGRPSKSGIVRVSSVTGSNSTSGSIVISVKIQK